MPSLRAETKQSGAVCQCGADNIPPHRLDVVSSAAVWRVRVGPAAGLRRGTRWCNCAVLAIPVEWHKRDRFHRLLFDQWPIAFLDDGVLDRHEPDIADNVPPGVRSRRRYNEKHKIGGPRGQDLHIFPAHVRAKRLGGGPPVHWAEQAVQVRCVPAVPQEDKWRSGALHIEKVYQFFDQGLKSPFNISIRQRRLQQHEEHEHFESEL